MLQILVPFPIGIGLKSFVATRKRAAVRTAVAFEMLPVQTGQHSTHIKISARPGLDYLRSCSRCLSLEQYGHTKFPSGVLSLGISGCLRTDMRAKSAGLTLAFALPPNSVCGGQAEAVEPGFKSSVVVREALENGSVRLGSDWSLLSSLSSN